MSKTRDHFWFDPLYVTPPPYNKTVNTSEPLPSDTEAEVLVKVAVPFEEVVFNLTKIEHHSPAHIAHATNPLIKDDEVSPWAKNAVRTFLYTLVGTTSTHMIDVKHTRCVLETSVDQSLFKGFGFNLATKMMRNAILMTGLPWWANTLKNHVASEHLDTIAFGAASVAEGIVWSPISVCTQYLYGRKEINNVRDVFRKIPRPELRAAIKHNIYWGGLIGNSLMAFPFMGIRSYGQDVLIHAQDSELTQAYKQFGIGVIAGFFANTLAYPTRWLCMKLVEFPLSNVRDVVLSHYKQQGIKVFYTGFGLAAARTSLVSGSLSFSLFAGDKICEYLGKHGFFVSAPAKRPDMDILNTIEERVVQANMEINNPKI